VTTTSALHPLYTVRRPRAPPGPAGGAKALPQCPRPLNRNKGGLLLKGGEGRGGKRGRGRKGRGDEAEAFICWPDHFSKADYGSIRFICVE